MGNFFIIIPFLIPIWIMYIAYKQYQDKKAGRIQKRASRFEKYGWYKYLRIIYVERGILKFWSAIWYFPLLFAGIGFFAGLYLSTLNFIFPPLTLSEMNHENGVIKSISIQRKMADKLVLEKEDGSLSNFYIRVYKNEQQKLVNKPVTIYYAFNRTSSISFGNIVYEVIVNKKSIRAVPYNYDKTVQSEKSLITLANNSLIIMVFSAFMIWIQNRKEKPYHRLYRLNRYKKLKKTLDITKE